MTPIIVASIFGSILPDLLRILNAQGDLSSYKSVNKWVSITIQIMLGLATVYIILINGKEMNENDNQLLQAVAYGFGAPEILTRAIGAIVNNSRREQETPIEKDKELKANKKSKRRLDLFDWWHV